MKKRFSILIILIFGILFCATPLFTYGDESILNKQDDTSTVPINGDVNPYGGKRR